MKSQRIPDIFVWLNLIWNTISMKSYTNIKLIAWNKVHTLPMVISSSWFCLFYNIFWKSYSSLIYRNYHTCADVIFQDEPGLAACAKLILASIAFIVTVRTNAFYKRFFKYKIKYIIFIRLFLIHMNSKFYFGKIWFKNSTVAWQH